MQTARIIQAVIIMTIVALAASCAATKDYTSKLFTPRTVDTKDTQIIAKVPRFLDLETGDVNDKNFVDTDTFLGRDTVTNIDALDNVGLTLTKAKDSAAAKAPIPSNKNDEQVAIETEPVVKITKAGQTRTKRTRQ